jgi:hypothetical protein
MKTVNLFGVALKYPYQWELHFGKAPTERVGGFELLLKENHKIISAICVVWRPCDDATINSLLVNQNKRAGLKKSILMLGGNTEPKLKGQKARDFSDEELVTLYCDGIYANIAKEQGPVTMIKREKRQVNAHEAEFSEFTFPINKRRKDKGSIYRMQLVTKCNISNRFIALYTSSQKKTRDEYLEQIKTVFDSLECHQSY